MHNIIKAISEFAPIAIFFITYKLSSLENAITAIIICSIISLIIYKFYLKVIPKMFLVTNAIIIGFGGASIYFHDPMFFKMKPTVCYFILGCILIYDRIKNNKHSIKLLPFLSELEPKHLKILSVFWILYSFGCASANELVWRNFGEDIWVNFKVFGLLSMNMAFMLFNVLFINKVRKQESE